MKRTNRRGISFGTIVMIVITVFTIALFAQVLPQIAGQVTLEADVTQRIMTTFTNNLHLPKFSLADIPIFKSSEQSTHSLATAAPTLQPDKNSTIDSSTVSLTTVPTLEAERVTFSFTAAGAFAADNIISKAAYYKESDTYDYSNLLTFIRNHTIGDIAICSFENLLDSTSKISDINTSPMALEALRVGGFDLLFAGHEAAMDLGLDGLSETVNTIRHQGFSVVGAYPDASESEKISILNINGVNVAFLHYTESINTKGKKNIQKDNAAYALNMLDTAVIARDIATAKQQGANIVIVSLHWGKDNVAVVSKTQQKIAQDVANAGADVILGAHSQTVSSISFLTGTDADGRTHQTLVAYSLGALLTSLRDSKNIDSILLHVTMSYDKETRDVLFESVTYTPTYFWRYKEDGRYFYHLVPSNVEPPESMAQNQREVMAKSYKRIKEILKDSDALEQ